MAGERKYTRIPPESTGDRVLMVHTAEIEFDNKNPTNYVWNTSGAVDYRLTGAGTGAGQEFTFHLHGVYSSGVSTGRLAVHFSEDARELGYNAIVDQEIQYNNGGSWVTIATVAQSSQTATNIGSYDIVIPAQNIVGGVNPENKLDIDRFGSAQVTFSEGTPELTAFGGLKINDAKLLAAYDFTLGKQPQQFVNSNEGTGSYVIWDNDPNDPRVTSPDGVPNRVQLCIKQGIKPSRATHTSNLFHSYIPGSGILYVFGTLISGEDTNVVRNWGAFDATDGYFFQRNEGLNYVVHRNIAVLGVNNDMKVEQTNWNIDTMDGAGGDDNPSGYTLDVTQPNTYWIDYQFLGGGRTRWGIVVDGKRLTCHEMYHSNGEGQVTTTNPLSNPNRPLCWAIACPAAKPAGPANDARIFALGGGVWLESNVDPLLTAQQYGYSSSRTLYRNPSKQLYYTTRQSDGDDALTAVKNSGLSSGTSTQYLFTISPLQFYVNTADSGDPNDPGIENHSVYQPLKSYFSAWNLDDGSPTSFEIRVFAKCIVRGTNFSWGGLSSPTVAIDTTGDHLAHGPQIARITIDDNNIIDFSSGENVYQYNTVRNKSDQPFSRITQPIIGFNTSDDKYNTGNQRILVQVGTHPEWGSDVHYFEDRQPVMVANTTSGNDVTTVTPAWLNTNSPTFKNSGEIPGNAYASSDFVLPADAAKWYYLSLLGNNEAWLYDSLTGMDADRTVKVVTVDNAAGVEVGDVFLASTSGANGVVMYIDNNDLWLVQRNTNTNSDYVEASGWSAGTAGGTSTSACVDNTSRNDYWTSVNALSAADIGVDTGQTITSGLVLAGTSPPRAAWTFMAVNLTNTDSVGADLVGYNFNGYTVTSPSYKFSKAKKGQSLIVSNSENTGENDGTYTIVDVATNGSSITVEGTSNTAPFTTNAEDTTATMEFIGPDSRIKTNVLWRERNQ